MSVTCPPVIRCVPRGRHAGFDYAIALAVCALCALGACAATRQPDPGVHYVAFGDSATAGKTPRTYCQILSEMLGEPADRFANAGKGGEDTDAGLLRLRELLSRGVFPNARLLLYWEGGADIIDFMREHDPLLNHSPAEPGYAFADQLAARLDQTQANIEAAVQAGQDAGWQVLVATYYPTRESLWFCDPAPLEILLPIQAKRANEYMAMLNERIRAAAAAEAAILVDVAASGEQIRSDPANYRDCNHLSERGNQIVARLFFDAIIAHTAGD